MLKAIALAACLALLAAGDADAADAKTGARTGAPGPSNPFLPILEFSDALDTGAASFLKGKSATEAFPGWTVEPPTNEDELRQSIKATGAVSALSFAIELDIYFVPKEGKWQKLRTTVCALDGTVTLLKAGFYNTSGGGSHVAIDKVQDELKPFADAARALVTSLSKNEQPTIAVADPNRLASLFATKNNDELMRKDLALAVRKLEESWQQMHELARGGSIAEIRIKIDDVIFLLLDPGGMAIARWKTDFDVEEDGGLKMELQGVRGFWRNLSSSRGRRDATRNERAAAATQTRLPDRGTVLAMPTTVTVMSLSCPNRCRHCSYGEYSPAAYDQIRQICDALAANGYQPHFYDMHVTGESVAIFRATGQFERSNPGWLNVNCDFDPTQEEAAYLNGLRTKLVVSLHGSTPAIHALLAGRESEFDSILAALQRLRSKITLPLGINYVVHRGNVADIPSMIDFAQERLDVDFLELINLGYGGNSPRDLGQEMVLDRDSFIEAYNHLRYAQKRFGRFIRLDAQWGPDFVGISQPACSLFAAPVDDHFCNAGINHLALRADTLEVWPCPTFVTVPELRIGRYVDGVVEIDAPDILDSARLGDPCASCDLLSRCHGGCRSIAMCDAYAAAGRFDPNAGFINCLHASYRSGRIRLTKNPQAPARRFAR